MASERGDDVEKAELIRCLLHAPLTLNQHRYSQRSPLLLLLLLLLFLMVVMMTKEKFMCTSHHTPPGTVYFREKL